MTSMLRVVVLLALAARLTAPAGPPVPAGAPEEFALANGLRVRLAPDAACERSVVILGVRAGFLDEPAGVPHLAHVTEHLTVYDPLPREAKAVREWVASGRANGETLADAVYFDIQADPGDVAKAIEVQAARLAPAELSRETLAREAPRTLGEIDFVEKSKFPVAGKFALAPFAQVAYHGRADVPLRERTGRTTLAEVERFRREHFRPDRALLVVCGRFDPAAVHRAVGAFFGPIPAPAAPGAPRPRLRPGDSAATWDVATRHVFAAWPAPPPADPAHPALTLAALAVAEAVATDPALAACGRPAPPVNDLEGAFLAGLQLNPGVDPAAAKRALLAAVAGVADPEFWTDPRVRRLKRRFAQQSAEPDPAALPAGPTRPLALGNAELQRMLKSLAWGDLAAYRARVAGAETGAVRDAAATYLGAPPTVVAVAPAAK